MTALAASRVTPRKGPDQVIPALISLPIADNVKIYPGSLVMIDAGYAKPGATATGKIAVGRCASNVVLDNTGAGHAAGALQVPVDMGVFRWANSADADAIAQADVGNVCYLVDDQTVAKTDGSSSRSVAGVVFDVDSSGVWVLTSVPAAVLTAQAQPAQTAIISVSIPDLSGVADAQVVARITPGFAGRIIKTSFQATKAVTTALKATTLTPKIATVNVTGGVLALTSAGLDTVGKVVAGSSVTAANTFTSSQEITVVASATTAFVEGAGVLFLHIA